MPILTAHNSHPLVDGRQSQRALMVRRGVQRLLEEMQAVAMPEVTLASGRRADLLALMGDGSFWVIEIKSSIEDFRADGKWPEYRNCCDRLFFATHAEVPEEIFPREAGFILADGYGAEILRDAPHHKLAPATRKALMLRFARAGASRLYRAELAGAEIDHAVGGE